MKNILKTLCIAVLLLAFHGNANAQPKEGVVTIEQDDDITKLLDMKKDPETNNLYKIQVYSGRRSGAESAMVEFKNKFLDWPARMEYDTPYYKIQVGNFRNRLEANKALLKIKKEYPNAFIFKPKSKRKNP